MFDPIVCQGIHGQNFFFAPLFGPLNRCVFVSWHRPWESVVSVSMRMSRMSRIAIGGPIFASKHIRMIASNHSQFKVAKSIKKKSFSSWPSPRISWNSPQLVRTFFRQLGFPASRFKSSMTWFTTSMCSSCK